jgi:hypothetical protein
VSFFLSALVLGGVILWAYSTESLPCGLLTSVDHYILHMIKTRSLRFHESDIPAYISDDQVRRTHVLAGHSKALGDQQLTTGFAIIIAGLASRCQIAFMSLT